MCILHSCYQNMLSEISAHMWEFHPEHLWNMITRPCFDFNSNSAKRNLPMGVLSLFHTVRKWKLPILYDDESYIKSFVV